MKIVNATVYNSNDIYNLFIELDRLCLRSMEQRSIKWEADAKARGETWNDPGGYYKDENPLPKTLRVGYRSYKKLKPDAEVDATVTQPAVSYVTLSGRRTSSPRIGLPKPDHLPLNPLVVLANCAESAERLLPREVLQALARTFIKTRKGSPSDDDISYLLDDQPIRYSLSVSKEAKAAMKEAGRRALISGVENRLAFAERDVVNLMEEVDKAESKVAKLRAQLNKLQPKERMVLRV